jgi:hypothetical protein
MFEVVLYSVIAISVLGLLAVAHKYHIDTSGTIAELSKDRKLYQRMAWQEIEAREKFMKSHAAAIADLTTKLGHISRDLEAIEKLVEASSVSKKDKAEIFSKISSSLKDIEPFINVQSNASSPRVKRSF